MLGLLPQKFAGAGTSSTPKPTGANSETSGSRVLCVCVCVCVNMNPSPVKQTGSPHFVFDDRMKGKKHKKKMCAVHSTTATFQL